MTDPIRLSHSDISMWLQCRRLFDIMYRMDRNPPDRLIGAMAAGTRVHRAIGFFHATGDDPVKEFNRMAREDEEILRSVGAPVWDMDRLYSDIVEGRNCVIAYIDWLSTEAPFAGYDVESEVHLEHPFLDGKIILRGTADLVRTRKSDGAIFVDDVKTAALGSRSSVPDRYLRSYQTDVYSVLAKLLNPTQYIGGASYIVIFKSKNPARVTGPLVSRVNVPAPNSRALLKIPQLEAICSDIVDFIDARDADEAGTTAKAYPQPSDACRWCDVRHACTLLDENTASGMALIHDSLEHGTRHARYDAKD